MSGTVQFEGQDLTGRSTHDVVESGISMIPEGRQLFPNFTVRDNLIMGSFKRTARPIVQQKMDEVLQTLPRVKERLDQLAGPLSGGEKQLMAIAQGQMSDQTGRGVCGES